MSVLDEASRGLGLNVAIAANSELVRTRGVDMFSSFVTAEISAITVAVLRHYQQMFVRLARTGDQCRPRDPMENNASRERAYDCKTSTTYLAFPNGLATVNGALPSKLLAARAHAVSSPRKPASRWMATARPRPPDVTRCHAVSGHAADSKAAVSATHALVWPRRAGCVFVSSPGLLALRLPRAIGRGHRVSSLELFCVLCGVALIEPKPPGDRHCIGGQAEP